MKKEQLFYYENDVVRLTKKGNDIFCPKIAKDNGYEFSQGFADGQNFWHYRNRKGEAIFGSSDKCEERDSQYTELEIEFEELFLRKE